MNGTAFSFTLNGTHALALPSGALFVPSENLLCVSDLHLAKSERMARRRGAMLPPYETRATLDRLARDLAAAKPAIVVALGDSFDDIQASETLNPQDRATLASLQEGRRWVWIEGNHDAGAHNHGGEGFDGADGPPRGLGPQRDGERFRRAAVGTVRGAHGWSSARRP